MNIYCVYKDSSKNQDELLIVKQGFSIWAAIFNAAWAIYHKMWLLVIITCVVGVIAFPLEKLQLYYIFDIAILFVFGFFADDFRNYYIHKKGFVLSDIIAADNEEEAELKYYYNANYG
ncbi:MAG: hypothetical protein EKK61_02520 [Rickettsiales bacterium]|nr:MAG: hypothetical protein EKK61_02520 [Rickettsiales bacterium]